MSPCIRCTGGFVRTNVWDLWASVLCVRVYVLGGWGGAYSSARFGLAYQQEQVDMLKRF